MNTPPHHPSRAPMKEEPEASMEDDIPTDDAGSDDSAPIAHSRTLPTEAQIRSGDETDDKPGA